MRDTSKEIGDRVDHLYPTRPAAVNPQYLVDHMVRSMCTMSVYSMVYFMCYTVYSMWVFYFLVIVLCVLLWFWCMYYIYTKNVSFFTHIMDPIIPNTTNTHTYLSIISPQNTSVNAPGKRPLHGANHDCNKCTRLRRRNSTGTIFLSHTMSNQDNAATIECVCVVIRAHMLGEFIGDICTQYDVFVYIYTHYDVIFTYTMLIIYICIYESMWYFILYLNSI